MWGRITFILVSFVVSVTFAGASASADKPTTQEIIHAVRQFRESPVPQKVIKDLARMFKQNPKQATFLQMVYLSGDQRRISFDRVRTKTLDIEEKNGNDQLHFDGRKSLIPLHEPIRVALTPKGIVVVDGNHETLSSIFLGAKTIPVIVVADVSDMPSDAEALKKLEKMGLAYLRNLNGTIEYERVSISDYVDDPNRYLMSLVARRVKQIEIEGEWKMESHSMPQDVFIKFEEGKPFIEFILADILYDEKIVYNHEWGEEIPQQIVKRIRKVFRDAKAEGDPRLQNTAFVAHDTPGKHIYNDPNVYLAELIEQTITTRKNGKEFDDHEGAKYPLWVNLDIHSSNDRVAVAAALYRAGIIYDWKDGGIISDKMRDQIRDALIEEKKNFPERLENIAIVKKDVSKKEIDFEDVFHAFQKDLNICPQIMIF